MAAVQLATLPSLLHPLYFHWDLHFHNNLPVLHTSPGTLPLFSLHSAFLWFILGHFHTHTQNAHFTHTHTHIVAVYCYVRTARLRTALVTRVRLFHGCSLARVGAGDGRRERRGRGGRTGAAAPLPLTSLSPCAMPALASVPAPPPVCLPTHLLSGTRYLWLYHSYRQHHAVTFTFPAAARQHTRNFLCALFTRCMP